MTSAQVRLGVTPMGATVAVKRISKAKVRSLNALRSLAQEVAAIRALHDSTLPKEQPEDVQAQKLNILSFTQNNTN